ncbi:MAG: GtrA family protein [Gammaproteobacteria bacterium]|nr:GtrA family protein [Gammaproteobacteria bacterium]
MLISKLRECIFRSQELRFLLVGIYNTFFGLSIFALIYYLFGHSLHYLFVLIISYIISICSAYLLQKYLVFKTKKNYLLEFVRFNIVNFLVLMVNVLILPIFVGWFYINPVLGQAIFTVLTAVVSFLGHKFFSFKSQHHEAIT